MKRMRDENYDLLPWYDDGQGWKYCDTPFEDLNGRPLEQSDLDRIAAAGDAWVVEDWIEEARTKNWFWEEV